MGEEVAARFPASSIRRPASATPDAEPPRPFLDAPGDARRRLEELGVVVEEIAVCTRCDADRRLFSHRGDTGSTGRQAVLVWRD